MNTDKLLENRLLQIDHFLNETFIINSESFAKAQN